MSLGKVSVSNTTVVRSAKPKAPFAMPHVNLDIAFQPSGSATVRNTTFWNYPIPYEGTSTSTGVFINSSTWHTGTSIVDVPFPPVVSFHNDPKVTGAGNVAADPQLVGYRESGTFTTITTNPRGSKTVFTDPSASFEPGELVGTYLLVGTWAALSTCGNGVLDLFESCDSTTGCSDTCELESTPGDLRRWHVVVANTATTITVRGDLTDHVLPGDAYDLLDLRLQPTSPLLDKGTGDGASETDIDGLPRFDFGPVGGGFGAPNYVDIGAHEFNP
jgi:hypothetical protein